MPYKISNKISTPSSNLREYSPTFIRFSDKKQTIQTLPGRTLPTLCGKHAQLEEGDFESSTEITYDNEVVHWSSIERSTSHSRTKQAPIRNIRQTPPMAICMSRSAPLLYSAQPHLHLLKTSLPQSLHLQVSLASNKPPTDK